MMNQGGDKKLTVQEIRSMSESLERSIQKKLVQRNLLNIHLDVTIARQITWQDVPLCEN